MNNDQEQFAIHVNEFDGPLELLLHLIKQSKMSIYDIQIESITAQYVEYLNQMKGFNIDLVSEYFVMASNLMAIKSKMLLPINSDLQAEDDPRDDLVNQLIVYQAYKQRAGDLKHRYNDRAKLHSRAEVVPNYVNGLIETHDPLDLQILKNAFQRVISNHFDAEDAIVEVSEWQYSVEEQIQWVNDSLNNHEALDLDWVFKHQSNLEALITTFLAILELIKQHQVKVFQLNHQSKISKR